MKAAEPQVQAAPPEGTDVAPSDEVTTKPRSPSGHQTEGQRILERIDRKHRLFVTRKQAIQGKRHRIVEWLLPWGRRLTTMAIAMVAVVMALVTWDYYVTAPWTRDGRVRVQVARVAPEVSGK